MLAASLIQSTIHVSTPWHQWNFLPFHRKWQYCVIPCCLLRPGKLLTSRWHPFPSFHWKTAEESPRKSGRDSVYISRCSKIIDDWWSSFKSLNLSSFNYSLILQICVMYSSDSPYARATEFLRLKSVQVLKNLRSLLSNEDERQVVR